jgi:white-opaque regulator 2
VTSRRFESTDTSTFGLAMASISNTMTSPPDPFHRSDAFQSYAMSSFPPPPGRRAQHEELSRNPPTQSANAPRRPVNLPPLSSIDPRQQRPSHSPSPAEAQNQSRQPVLAERIPQYGTLLPSMSQYYGSQLNASGQYVGGPSVPVTVASAGSRFAIAPTSDPNSMISSSRHKKEVKKRTKTGCMTCRKRRIKVGNPKVLISPASKSFLPIRYSKSGAQEHLLKPLGE